jgi:hypothetical protein
MKDVVITISPRDRMGMNIVAPISTETTEQYHDTTISTTIPLPQRHREALEQRTGSFTYSTGALHDGYIEMCFQSYTANVEYPCRIAFDMYISTKEDVSSMERIVQQLEEERKLLAEQHHIETKLINGETSRITAELVRMHRRSIALVDDTQYSKQAEAEFHSLSIRLNDSIMFWYLFRFFILLLSGCIQVSYIMKYMKSRYLFY